MNYVVIDSDSVDDECGRIRSTELIRLLFSTQVVVCST